MRRKVRCGRQRKSKSVDPKLFVKRKGKEKKENEANVILQVTQKLSVSITKALEFSQSKFRAAPPVLPPKITPVTSRQIVDVYANEGGNCFRVCFLRAWIKWENGSLTYLRRLEQ